MGFYDLSKEDREKMVNKIDQEVLNDFKKKTRKSLLTYFSDEDTYIRKNAYQAVGKAYHANRALRPSVLQMLDRLWLSENEKVRQTTINAAGEIGKFDFKIVQHFFDQGLFDPHHSVRNAVIGSVKKMGERNPQPVLSWAQSYLHHPDKEIRREICHGIELRGRKYPQDILPLLKELQHDKTPRVRNTLIHVLGQIAYKKGCLQTVVTHLQSWENKALVTEALDEIVDVHERYKSFAILTQGEAIAYIDLHFNS